MKRLKMWIQELTLVQQLLLIIFSFVVVLGIFLFAILLPAVERFSQEEMFTLLHNSQDGIRGFVENGYKEDNLNEKAFVSNIIYHEKDDSFTVLMGEMIPIELQEEIRMQVKNTTEGTYDFTYQSSSDKQAYLYSFLKEGDKDVIISVVSNVYRLSFRQSLIDGIVVSNIMFVSILFILLMLWVSSLIIPLSQIKAYITKLKNDDPQKEELNIHRHDEIGEVADALQEMETELAKQSREKEEMIQNISHDLKTPIATIKSYGESIKDGIYPYETLEKSVDVIIEHADRLEQKVHSLIVLNKMGYLLDSEEEGEHLLMNDVIDKVVLSLKVIRPEIEFIKDYEHDVLFHGEEEPWRIVVENLVDNALRYAKTYIRIVLSDNEMCVINDGEKINPERLETLFHVYEKGNDGQFGIGLSIVYRVAITYGYRVRAENLQDGVCFRIWKDVKKVKANKKSGNK